MNNVNFRMLNRGCILSLFLAFVTNLSPDLFAQSEDQSPVSPSEQPFIRIEATLDIIRSLTADSFYLPMERDQFENIVSSLKSGTPDTVRRNVSIDRATYSARLVDQQLVAGEGSFVISSSADVETEIALDGLDLTIQRPRWRAIDLEAKLGVTNSGERVLLVPQSGICDFQWSLRGVASSSGADFEFTLCDSLQHQFTITTPINVDLRSNRGTVTLSFNCS